MKCLSFGINSASELFNEEIKKTISDIANCINVHDDIIVYGRTQKEHNEALLPGLSLKILQFCTVYSKIQKDARVYPRVSVTGLYYGYCRYSTIVASH